MVVFVKLMDFDMLGILLDDLVSFIVLEIENRLDATMRRLADKLVRSILDHLQGASRILAIYRTAGTLGIKALFRFGVIANRKFHDTCFFCLGC